MDFRPAASAGRAIGVALLLVLLCVGALAAALLVRFWPGPPAALLSLFLLAVLVATALSAYWVWGLFSMRYAVSRDGIVVHWAASRHTVPVGDITHILAGRPYAEPLRGLKWPGHEVGRTRLVDEEIGERDLLVIATTPPEQQIVLVTPALAYAVSPADRKAFVDEFKLRLRLGALQHLEHHSSHPIADRLPITRDPLDLALAGSALAVNVLAFTWLIWHYPSLPELVALRHVYDTVAGRPDVESLQPLRQAWQLPVIGLAALLVNGSAAAAVHGRARLGAHLLMLGAVLLGIVVFVVLLHMVP
jgi:hypothetical protein